MTALTVFVFMFALVLLGVPIVYAIGIPSLVGFMMDGTATTFVTASFKGLDSFPLMAVPFFILAGKLMEHGGISERLINLVNYFVGKKTGGLAIVAVVACAAFGAISGSAIATSVSIGGILIPGMVEKGYRKSFCAALICISGTIGALIPPSMSFILYGTVTGASVGDLFIAGVGPGLLLTLALCITAYIISKKNGWTGSWEVERSLKNFLDVFMKSISALLVPVIILGGIYGGIFTPTEAGAIACGYALILTLFIYKSLNLKKLYQVFVESADLCVVMLVIAAFASGFARYISMERIPQAISAWLVAVSGSRNMFLFIVVIFMLLLGCVMDFTPAIIIVAPIFAPIAATFGINTIHFGMIMNFCLLVGLSTPPVGSNLYVMASMADIKFTSIIKELGPFYIATFVALMMVTYIEKISTFLLEIFIW